MRYQRALRDRVQKSLWSNFDQTQGKSNEHSVGSRVLVRFHLMGDFPPRQSTSRDPRICALRGAFDKFARYRKIVR
jgi:hypothetical protein